MANPMAKLKNIGLRDLDLGGTRTIGNNAAWQTHMLATCNYPENYDYTFFSVFNPDRNNIPSGAYASWQNYFDSATGLFNLTSAGITPFVKIEYLLKQIFEAEDTGYFFNNAWQDNIELKRLYLYNNVDAKTASSNPTTDTATLGNILLKDFIPNIKSVDFLKKILAHFNLGLFVNQFNKTISLLNLDKIINNPASHDWTKFVLSEYTIEQEDSIPKAFNYPEVVLLPKEVRPDEATLIKSIGDYNAIAGSLPDGWYYLESGTSFFKKTGSQFESWDAHAGVYPDASQDRFDTGVTGLTSKFQAFSHYVSPVVVSRWVNVDGSSPTQYKFQIVDYPLAFCAYRGMQVDFEGETIKCPIASNHVWKASGTNGARYNITTNGVSTGPAKYSLNWDGEYGLYKTHHQNWNQMLLNGKSVTQKFIVPIAELLQFRFEDKVRVLNMDFFMKKIKVEKTVGKGLILIEASMVSVF